MTVDPTAQTRQQSPYFSLSGLPSTVTSFILKLHIKKMACSSFWHAYFPQSRAVVMTVFSSQYSQQNVENCHVQTSLDYMFTSELIPVVRQQEYSDWHNLHHTCNTGGQGDISSSGILELLEQGREECICNRQPVKDQKGLLHPLLSHLCRLRIAHRNSVSYTLPTPLPQLPSLANCHWPLKDVVPPYLRNLQLARPNMSQYPF